MMKPEAIIGNLAGHALPSNALLAKLGRPTVLDDIVAVDAFSRLLTEALERCTKNGRLDTKEAAAFMLATMRDNSNGTR